MMKFMTVAASALLILASCGEKKAKEQVQDEPFPQAFLDEHTAKNALTYNGTYIGRIPTASGEGMNVTITLTQDETYKKTISYEGKNDTPIETTGKYKWDDTGSIITLEGEELPNQYFVEENQLVQLDTEGKRVEGELADKQILKQVETPAE